MPVEHLVRPFSPSKSTSQRVRDWFTLLMENDIDAELIAPIIVNGDRIQFHCSDFDLIDKILSLSEEIDVKVSGNLTGEASRPYG